MQQHEEGYGGFEQMFIISLNPALSRAYVKVVGRTIAEVVTRGFVGGGIRIKAMH